MSKDLRSFLADAKAAGRLYATTKPVDPRTQLGALADAADRAILFENIAGYPGSRVVANLAMNRDMERVIFGVDTRAAVVRAMAAGLDRGPQPRIVVPDSPAKAVVWSGDDANLKRLPIVQHSELDGGPYVGGAIGIVVDPDTGMHNTTWPRTQVADGKNCPFMIFSQHVGRIAGKYAQRGEPMPMALVIGMHPAWEIAASLSVHHPHCGELDYAASLLGEPAEFVRCDTIPIEVPAGAEIIVEGVVLPGALQSEGPFGNYLGTYCSGPMSRDGVQKAPVFRVDRITTRKDPIYRHVQSTIWTEHQRLAMLPNEGSLFNALSEMGVEIHDVYFPPWGGCSLCVLQMTPRAPGDARDALMKALTMENTTLGFMSQLAVAVNRDVDPYDARDVLWAMTIRANWGKDTVVIPNLRASPLMPSADRVPGGMFRLNGKAIVDATILPPKDDTEWWEAHRVWPMGHGRVRLGDFVDVAPDAAPALRRMVSHEESVALKPGRKPVVGGGQNG